MSGFHLVTQKNPLPTKRSVNSSWAMTPGTPGNPGSKLAIVATVAGNVSVTLESGSVFVFPVAVGLTIVDFIVTQVNTSGTTATATYTNMA